MELGGFVWVACIFIGTVLKAKSEMDSKSWPTVEGVKVVGTSPLRATVVAYYNPANAGRSVHGTVAGRSTHRQSTPSPPVAAGTTS